MFGTRCIGGCMDKCSFIEIVSHDAFRFGGGLNKSAGEVYWYLLQKPMSASTLVSITGRSRRTVFRVLAKMSGLVDTMTGELIQLVDKRDGIWHAIPVDLDLVARVIGTVGKGEKQRRQHKEDRRVYRRVLEAWKQENSNQGM
jgi:hypothetical protein